MPVKILENSVAIIGCSSRFPGSENNHEFWKTLEKGQNHITETPPDRWSVDAFYDEFGDAPGKTYIRHGGFIDRLHEWDNQVFGINDIEADKMDPQQKLSLELSFRALENAGLTKEKLKGTDTAVYMGHMNDDFPKLASFDPSFADSYTATSSSGCVISNRISYIYDLHGPSMTLDTACSSSLVCVHLGSKSILSGESEMAICGGVNVILYPGATICLGKAKMASTTGQCRAFSDTADGYVRGEGCGVVVLKSAEKALQDKDRIWGFITTACNSDGQDAIPMTAPSAKRQQILIEETIKRANIHPTKIQYVEMHGPGTQVGDPVETAAVGAVYGKARKENNKAKLPIGSVKTNIGHLESTAGVAGLIKILLMMKYEKIAPSLWCEKESSKINFEDLHISVVKQVTEWPLAEKYRCAAVNSFGFGGTNVHAIIQATQNKSKKKDQANLYPIVCFSGMSHNSLKVSIQETVEKLMSGEIRNFESLSQTSISSRDLLPFRYGSAAHSLKELEQDLQKASSLEKIGTKAIRKNVPYNVLFVFCGTGSHWENMGLELYERFKPFRMSLKRIDEVFEPLAGYSIVDCLQGKYDLSQPQYGQPAVGCLQLALVDLWEYYGITPHSTVGHSLGELAAAYASKKLNLESTIGVMCSRLEQLKKISGGGMLVVGNILTEDIQTFINEKGFEGQLSIAAYNTTTSCTISGDEDAIDSIEKQLHESYSKNNIFLRKLPVTTAYHSHYLDPILQDLEESLPPLNGTGEEGIQLFSTVSGKAESTDAVHTKKHWVKNARDPVLFKQALCAAMTKDCKYLVIEIGPKPDLRSAIRSIAKDLEKDVTLLPSLTVSNCSKTFFTSLTKCFEFGLKVKCKRKSELCDFPRYGLDRKFHFQRPKNSEFVNGVAVIPLFHPFITLEDELDEKMIATTRITPYTAPFVYEHIFMGKVVIPGAIYVESVASSLLHHGLLDFDSGDSFQLSVNFKKGCILPKNTAYVMLKSTLFNISQENKGVKEFEFDVTTPDNLHSSGLVKIGSLQHRKPYNLGNITQRCTTIFTKEDLYSELRKSGFEHGPLLQCVTSGSKSNTEVLASININDPNFHSYTIHPIMFDCVLQLVAMVPVPFSKQSEVTKVPVAVRNLQVLKKPPPNVRVYLHMKGIEEQGVIIDAIVMNTAGEVFLIFEGIRTVAPGKDVAHLKDLMYSLTWYEVQPTPVEAIEEKVILFSNLPKRIEKKLSDASMGHFIIPYSMDTVHAIINDGTSISSYLPDDITQYSQILYTWASTTGIDDLNGDMLSNHMGNICFVLLQLILHIEQKHPNMTINIITSNVYSIMEGCPKDERAVITGCLGASVWGMMRTVLKEMPFQHFRCVDVSSLHEPVHIELLQSIVFANQEDVELAIHEGTTLACYLMPITQSLFDRHKQVNVPPKSRIILQSENSDSTMDHRVIQSQVDEKDLYSQTSESLNVTKLYIPDQGLGLTTPISNTVQSTKLFSLGSIGEFKGKHYHCVKIEAASSKTEFHKDVMLPITAFPSSTPSSCLWMISWIFAQRVLKQIPKGAAVQVLSVKRDHILQFTVSQILRQTGCNLKEINENNHTEIGYYLIVALFENDVKELCKENMFVNSNPIYILTWSKNSVAHLNMYEKIFQHSIQLNIPQFKIMTVEELLTDSSFNESVVSFQKWLGKMNSKTLRKIVQEVDELIDENIPTISYSSNKTLNGDTIIEIPSESSDLVVKGNISNLFRGDSCYLVVGGSKGLGFEIVSHLVHKGAGYIGILSRTGITEQNKDKLKKLQEENKFEYIDLIADVCDYHQLSSAIEEMKQYKPHMPLRGVFFGVILLDNAIIPNMTLHKFNRVLRPKVIGAWNIYQICKGENLDYFVTHSSIASVIGSPGQTNYSAANAFTDAIASYRKRSEGVGQTICWGALELGVLEDNVEARRKIAKYGMNSLKPQDTMRALDKCLLIDSSLVMCTDLNWTLITKGIPAESVLERLMGRIIQRRGHFVKKHTMKKNKLSTGKDFNKAVTQLLQTVLMLDDDEMNPDATLDDLGIDSQQLTVIYSTLVDSYGSVPMSPLDIPGMTIHELIENLQNITVDKEPETNETVEEHTNDEVIQESAMQEMKGIMAEQVSKVTNGKLPAYESGIGNGMIKDGTAGEPIQNGYVSGNNIQTVAAKRANQYMMIEGGNPMSYLYDGQYFFDEKDKEIMLQIRRKTKAEFILTATDKCDQINTTIPLSTISETVLINEDDPDEAVLIIKTQTGAQVKYKADELSKLHLCKTAIEHIIEETKKATAKEQQQNYEQKSKTCIIL